MHHSEIRSEVRKLIADGTVLPAHPLALDADRSLDVKHQRALTRYYIDAGAGGLAVGVHTTQFAIRDVGMYRPVLELAAETAAAWTERPLAMVAGLAGPTQQAIAEAQTALGIGYHAGLLSLAAMKSASEDDIISHCEAVARVIPLVGFYLQPAVGGVILSADFWRRFAAIDNVIAIKIAPFNRYRTLDVLVIGRYGRQVRSGSSKDARPHAIRIPCRPICWRSMRASPIATARSSTSPTISTAASPAVTKFCGGRAC